MRYTQTPTPSITATPSLTPSNTPSYTPSETACSGLTPTATSSQTPTPTPTRTLSITPTITPTKTATPTPTPTNACPCYSYNAFSDSATQSGNISWINCNGSNDSYMLPPLNSITFCACSGSPSTSSFFITIEENGPCETYLFLGGLTTYDTSDSACFNRNCGRPYYSILPTLGIGSQIFDDSFLTVPFNGGNNWIALNLGCSGSWYVVQVNSTGYIINTSSPCP